MENCSEYFDTKFWYNFVRHMYEHTLVDDSNLSLYECICCGYGTNVQDRMTRHLDANGRYHNNECTQCDQKFLSHVDYHVMPTFFPHSRHEVRSANPLNLSI